MRNATIKAGDKAGAATVITYVDALNVLVEFDETKNRQWTTAHRFRKQTVTDDKKKTEEAIHRIKRDAMFAVDKLELELHERAQTAERKAYIAAGLDPRIKPGATVKRGQWPQLLTVISATPGQLVSVSDGDKVLNVRPEVLKVIE
jgi:hypothetical protein